MKIDIQIHLEELQRRITSHLRSCIENHERDRSIRETKIPNQSRVVTLNGFGITNKKPPETL